MHKVKPNLKMTWSGNPLKLLCTPFKILVDGSDFVTYGPLDVERSRL